MSDQSTIDSAEAFAKEVSENADDNDRISALEKQVAELSAEVEALKNAPAAVSSSDLSPTEVLWIRTVVNKFHSGEKPVEPAPVDPVA